MTPTFLLAVIFFGQPQLLPWLSLAAIVVALYLFKRKPKTVEVSTLPFFKSLSLVYRESPWIRRLKRLVSFLLSMLMIVLPVLVLARVGFSPFEDQLRSVVVVLDTSASMDARDAEDRSGLDRARAMIKQKISTLPSGSTVLFMTYDVRPEIRVSHTLNRRAVLRSLDTVGARPVPGNSAQALHLAARLAELETPSAVWHFTDREMDSAPAQPEGVTNETFVVPCTGANAGITAFQVRRLPLEHDRLEAFVEVAARGDKAMAAQLDVRIGEQLVEVRKLDLEPGEPQQFLVPVNPELGDKLELRLNSTSDHLESDNAVYASLPELRAVRLLWVRNDPDPFTELALAAITNARGMEAYVVDGDQWPVEGQFDLIVFDGWLPDEWPTDTATLVIRPPAPCGPVQAVALEGDGLPVASLRTIAYQHPILHGVASTRVALTQTAVVDTRGPMLPLWTGPRGPLLCAGELRGQRVVIFAFSPQHSERLPLMASYPLLLGNALLWLEGQSRDIGGQHRTGDVIDAHEGSLSWWSPSTSQYSAPIEIEHALAELDQVGIWKIDDRTGSAALLDRTETYLSQARIESIPAVSSEGESRDAWELTQLLIWLVILILVVEAVLFHRYSFY